MHLCKTWRWGPVQGRGAQAERSGGRLNKPPHCAAAPRSPRCPRADVPTLLLSSGCWGGVRLGVMQTGWRKAGKHEARK